MPEESIGNYHKLIETFAAQVVVAEAGDIPSLGELLKLLDSIIKSEIYGAKEIGQCLRDLVEKLILEEETDTSPLEDGVDVLRELAKAFSNKEEIDSEKLDALMCRVNCSIKSLPENEPSEAKPLSASEDISLYIEFAQESIENLEKAEVDLIELEENPEDSSLINSVFRAFHTIKGVSGFLELDSINLLAHKTETLLDRIRQKEIDPNSEVTDIILKSVDLMKKMINDILFTAESQGSISKKEWEIESFIEVIDNVSEEQKDIPIGELLVKDKVVRPEDVERGLERQKLEPSKKIGEILSEESGVSKKDIHKALIKQSKLRKNSYAVKVDTEKLDALVDLTGELVIAQSILKELSRGKDLDNRFLQSLGQMNQIISSVQKISMSMRMVPIGNTFQKMIRVVRDVSSNLGKKVELFMEGKDTEVDRNMVDALYEPLVHMVRNSVDHGIENPSERKAKGKDGCGKIILSSYHKAGNIVIEITDDGKGLDKDFLIEKAVKKGIVSEPERLGEKDIFNLIFHPGFSTAENVTDVSGRGVGMDVVKEAIENLKGHLDISSKKDEGTKFIIRLPLTMAIIDGMLIRVGKEKYIVPTMSILEAVPFEKKNYFTVEKKGEMIKARNELIPLVRLNMLCNALYDDKNENLLVLIVENKGEKCGLLLDELLGKDEFVIKNLGNIFKDTKVFSGGAILGDGRVGLIIDIAGLFEWSSL
ncbi:MAG: chemotaxis protein CheA [Desulfobacteraceae bacterium]|nr:chemotaxis protein CheA [Desulfobacteraceae bacterium]MCB9494135.1 chemotaxis protein CheA [Desulfobacteraceae bacterium]